MDLQAELRRPAAYEAALRAVQKPPAKPWRGGSSSSSATATPPPPPKVYRVEPREFRDLVQRLTGAPPAAAASGGGGVMRPQHHHQVAAVVQPVPVRASSGDQQQQLYGSPWFSFPLAGVDGGGGLI